jgi:hypothetical protein
MASQGVKIIEDPEYFEFNRTFYSDHSSF